MKRIVALFILLFIYSYSVYACKCREVSVKEGIESSDVILKGRVLSMKVIKGFDDQGMEIETKDFPAPLRAIKIKVEFMYKGKLNTDSLTILTQYSGVSCGYESFEVGKDFIIYGEVNSGFFGEATKNKNKETYLWTNSCTRTQKWNEGEDKALRSILNLRKFIDPSYKVEEAALPQGKVVEFQFLADDDTFHVPFRGNGDKLKELEATIQHYKSVITSGIAKIEVEAYCSSFNTSSENLKSASLRANRVKSELIKHSDMQENYFTTRINATPYDGQQSVVVVRLRVPQIGG